MKSFYFVIAVSASMGCVFCNFLDRDCKISLSIFLSIAAILFTASSVLILFLSRTGAITKKIKIFFVILSSILIMSCSFFSSYIYNSKAKEYSFDNTDFNKNTKSLYVFKKKCIDYLNFFYNENLSEESSGFPTAVILGDTSKINQSINSDLKKSGLYHFLAISGFHISMFTGFLSYILIKAAKVFKIKLSISVFIFLFIALYVFIVGPKAGVMRASATCCMALAAKDLKQDYRSSNLFFIAYVFLIIINPGFITDVSFQLSFASSFAIIFIYPLLNDLLELINVNPDFRRNIFFKSILISLSVNICIIPIIAFYFKGFYPYSLISTAVASPLFFITFFLLFFSSLLSFFWYLGASVIIRFSEPLISFIFKTANFFAGLPSSFLKTNLFKNMFFIIIYYISAGLIFLLIKVLIDRKSKNN